MKNSDHRCLFRRVSEAMNLSQIDIFQFNIKWFRAIAGFFRHLSKIDEWFFPAVLCILNFSCSYHRLFSECYSSLFVVYFVFFTVVYEIWDNSPESQFNFVVNSVVANSTINERCHSIHALVDVREFHRQIYWMICYDNGTVIFAKSVEIFVNSIFEHKTSHHLSMKMIVNILLFVDIFREGFVRKRRNETNSRKNSHHFSNFDEFEFRVREIFRRFFFRLKTMWWFCVITESICKKIFWKRVNKLQS